MIDCDSWSAFHNADGGKCARGLFGGYPSLGTCNGCEFNRNRGSAPIHADPFLAAKSDQERQEKFHALWRSIHERPSLYIGKPIDVEAEQAFIHTIGERLRAIGGCSCHNDWIKLRNDQPPDFSSPRAYAAWGWNVHCKVSMKLGKLVPTFAKACEIHKWPMEWAKA